MIVFVPRPWEVLGDILSRINLLTIWSAKAACEPALLRILCMLLTRVWDTFDAVVMPHMNGAEFSALILNYVIIRNTGECCRLEITIPGKLKFPLSAYHYSNLRKKINPGPWFVTMITAISDWLYWNIVLIGLFADCSACHNQKNRADLYDVGIITQTGPQCPPCNVPVSWSSRLKTC